MLLTSALTVLPPDAVVAYALLIFDWLTFAFHNRPGWQNVIILLIRKMLAIKCARPGFWPTRESVRNNNKRKKGSYPQITELTIAISMDDNHTVGNSNSEGLGLSENRYDVCGEDDFGHGAIIVLTIFMMMLLEVTKKTGMMIIVFEMLMTMTFVVKMMLVMAR